MFRFLLGMTAVTCLITYSDDIKNYTVEVGLRDLAIAYLKTW